MVERAASIQRAMVERVASIQRGRWHYIFYKGKVEDELHFVFRCQLYETLPERANLLQFCQDKLNSCYNYLEDIEKFKLLWSAGNSQALYLLGVFLLEAFHTRKQYIMNHVT